MGQRIPCLSGEDNCATPCRSQNTWGSFVPVPGLGPPRGPSEAAVAGGWDAGLQSSLLPVCVWGVQPVFVRASYPGPEEEAPGVHS